MKKRHKSFRKVDLVEFQQHDGQPNKLKRIASQLEERAQRHGVSDGSMAFRKELLLWSCSIWSNIGVLLFRFEFSYRAVWNAERPVSGLWPKVAN